MSWSCSEGLTVISVSVQTQLARKDDGRELGPHALNFAWDARHQYLEIAKSSEAALDVNLKKAL